MMIPAVSAEVAHHFGKLKALREAPKIVNMCEFQGQIFVATERGVFRLLDGMLVPIPFATPEDM
jgi:hypothetical protein